jgi:hypothetical protein
MEIKCVVRASRIFVFRKQASRNRVTLKSRLGTCVMLSHVRAALRSPSYLRPIAAFSTVVRRVLDIGSGSIKCEVAEVEPTSK